MARPRFANLDVDTRYRILETAGVEFAARGYEGVSLNQLIERLGMSKGSFYYYFDDKADLFSTVADLAGAIASPAGDLDLGSIDATSFWPSFESLHREASARARANPWLVGFLRLLDGPSDDVRDLQEVRDRVSATRVWQEEVIRRGQELGVVRRDLPIGFLEALVGGARERAEGWLLDAPDGLSDRQVEGLRDAVFTTIRRMLEPPG